MGIEPQPPEPLSVSRATAPIGRLLNAKLSKILKQKSAKSNVTARLFWILQIQQFEIFLMLEQSYNLYASQQLISMKSLFIYNRVNKFFSLIKST